MLSGIAIPDLGLEAEQLLLSMVDIAGPLPRSQQQFLYSHPLGVGGANVRCGNRHVDTLPQDVTALRSAGLIDPVGPAHSGSSSYLFTITHLGHRVAEAVKQRGEPLEKVEDEPVRYLAADDFKSRYPGPAQKWAHAARLLAEDPIGNTTRIGHDCREALASFASLLAARHDAGHPDNTRGTVDSVRSVIACRRPVLGPSVAALLDALVVYWGTASDLAQRQEHGAQREGEPLTVEDARRVVWYSALVMYELDRTLG